MFEHDLKKISKKFLFANLKKLGIKKNDTVYFGLDLKNYFTPFLGFLRENPKLINKNILNKIFFENLKDYFLPNGTAIFQSFTWSFIKNKKFNKHSSVPDIGILEKYIFNKPGVSRSSHPINSIISFGKKRKFITNNHGLFSFGANSPFEKFLKLNLKFVNIGIPFENTCTYIHHLEQINGTNHRFNKLVEGKIFVNNKYIKKNFFILVKFKEIDNRIKRDEKKFFDYLRRRKKLVSVVNKKVLFSKVQCADVYKEGLYLLNNDSSYFMKKNINVKFLENKKKIKKNLLIY